LNEMGVGHSMRTQHPFIINGMKATLPRASRTTKILLISAAGLAGFFLFTFLIHSASQKSVLGADFYTFWMAGKAVFQEHANPYSQAVTEQIQLGKLGRLANPGEDQMAFAYPPYSLLIVLPGIFVAFDWASAGWLALNISVLTLLIFFLPARSRSFLLTTILFYPVFLTLVLGQFDLIAGSGVILFFGWMVIQKKTSPGIQVVTAVLLAWATSKPQFIWLMLGFILLYAVREKMRVFLITFFTALAGFLLLSFLLIPTWVSDWINGVRAYTQYIQSQPTITELLLPILPAPAAQTLSIILFFVFLALAAFLLLRWWKNQLHWLKVAAWLGMMTYLFHLHGISYEQVIFLIPLILWAAAREQWFAPDILFFWGASLVYSWAAFALGMNALAIDRSPVLLNLVWVGWLLRKPRFQL
jgi:hypothetical protein